MPLLSDVAADRGGSFQGSWYAVQECLRSALSSIRAHGLRSSLTMLGIVIGVASVICVIALVQGLSQSISQPFQGLGGSTLTLRSYTPLEDQMRGKRNRLRSHRPGRAAVSHRRHQQHHADRVRGPGNRHAGSLWREHRERPDVRHDVELPGRAADFPEERPLPDGQRRCEPASRRRARRADAQDLKLPENPAGEFVQIGNEWFKVVGVLESRGEMFGISQDNYLLMPFQTAIAVNGVHAAARPVDHVHGRRPRGARQHETARRDADATARIRSTASEPDDFRVEASDMIAKTFKQISTTITLVVAGIVSISLLVGGVGIMNIMLVSVTERTREIGIAQGARARVVSTC